LEVQVEQDAPHLELHFELEGEKTYKDRTSRQGDISIPAGSHSLLYIPELKGELGYIPIHEKKKEIGIEFSLDYFSRLFNNDLSVLGNFGKDMLAGRPVMLGEGLATSPAMRQALQDVLHCPMEGMMKKIYVESKVLELVALVVNQAKQSLTRDTPGLRKEDVERLHYAREIILQRMNEPCSLMQLARLTGLNDFKLKKGFRDLFGTTVFGYLLEERMNLARRRLLEGDMSIAAIAMEVGYKNATHFTAAFKKHFGYLPSDVKNGGRRD
jgi:AraC-like DNA-binding protein